MYCDKNDALKKVRTCSRYIEVLEPHKADAASLVQCLCKALNSTGIETLFDKEKVLAVMEHPVLVGVGTDGAAVNISDQN